MKMRFIMLISVFFTLAFNAGGQEAEPDSIVIDVDVNNLPVVTPYYFQHQYL